MSCSSHPPARNRGSMRSIRVCCLQQHWGWSNGYSRSILRNGRVRSRCCNMRILPLKDRRRNHAGMFKSPSKFISNLVMSVNIFSSIVWFISRVTGTNSRPRVGSGKNDKQRRRERHRRAGGRLYLRGVGVPAQNRDSDSPRLPLNHSLIFADLHSLVWRIWTCFFFLLLGGREKRWLWVMAIMFYDLLIVFLPSGSLSLNLCSCLPFSFFFVRLYSRA